MSARIAGALDSMRRSPLAIACACALELVDRNMAARASPGNPVRISPLRQFGTDVRKDGIRRKAACQCLANLTDAACH